MESNKSSPSLIMGQIKGISRSDFLKIRSALQNSFDKVAWKDGYLVIKSERVHTDVKAIFQKISDRIPEGNYGSLLYVGYSRVACIYFGQGRFAAKEYAEPVPPDWWGGGKQGE